MNKFDKQIMVVPRDRLFSVRYFEGFLSADEFDFEKEIIRHFTYERRGIAEQNSELKQPIAYCLIVNREVRQVFAYQRSSVDGEYDEKRLQGKWSWGVGGHIERHDVESENPVRTSMLRELGEEVDIRGSVNPIVLGYINDDQTQVGSVHFGILYLIETNATEVHAVDSEIAWGGFVGMKRVDEILRSPDCEVESWSEIAAGPLRTILEE